MASAATAVFLRQACSLAILKKAMKDKESEQVKSNNPASPVEFPWRGQIHTVFVATAQAASDWRLLKRLKVTHVINVSAESMNFFSPDDITLSPAHPIASSLLSQMYSEQEFSNMIAYLADGRRELSNITYLYLPFVDRVDQDIRKYRSTVIQFFERALANDGRVLVHCKAGISRSVSTLIMFLMVSVEMTYEEALNLIKSSRPMARPNSGFQRQLETLEVQPSKQQSEQS